MGHLARKDFSLAFLKYIKNFYLSLRYGYIYFLDLALLLK